MTLQATVSMGWVRTVLTQACSYGLTESAVLQAAGIPARDLHLGRWPIDHITRLWRAAAKLTQDASFGLKVGAHAGLASFSVVGFIVQSASTLRQALTAVQKYQSLISDGGRFQMLPGEHASWLVYHPCQGDLAFSPHQIESVLAAVVSVTAWLIQHPPSPQMIYFSHEQVGSLPGYREVFQCPVVFGQAYSGILIDNGLLDTTLPQGDAQLAQMHDRYAAAQLRAMAHAVPIDQALLAWIQTHIGPPWPTRAAAAKGMGLSERTLARRLGARLTSYSALLDQVLRDRALQQLGTTDASLQDIATSLGFADISPFYRAFHRWTGTTPGHWRTQQLLPPSPR